MIGELSALGSAFTWALVSVLLRRLQYRINALSLNAIRTLIAALLSITALIATNRLDGMASIPASSTLLLVLSVLVGMVVGDTLYFYGLKLVGVARGLPLSNAYPVLVAIIAFVVHGEPITTKHLVGTLLVIVGVVMVLIPGRALLGKASGRDRRGETLGIVACLAASFLWACGTNVVKLGAADVDSLAANTIRLTAAGSVLMLASAFSPRGLQLREYRGSRLREIVLTGFVSAFSSLTFLVAIQTIGAAKTATLTSTAPLFGVPLSMLAGEKLTWRIALGSLISVCGIALVVST